MYTPDEAERLNVRIAGVSHREDDDEQKPPRTCPECGMPEDECVCGVVIPEGPPPRVRGEGAANQAFQQVADQCQEHAITHLRRLFVTIDGLGKQVAEDMRALGLAIPQFGKGRFAIKLDLQATFAQDEGQETFTQSFEGGWQLYKRLKTVTDNFAQEASALNVRMRAAAAFDDGLEIAGDQFATMRDVLVSLGLGKIVVEGVTIIPARGGGS